MNEGFRELKWTCPLCSCFIKKDRRYSLVKFTVEKGCFGYANGRYILNDINFSVKEREILGMYHKPSYQPLHIL